MHTYFAFHHYCYFIQPQITSTALYQWYPVPVLWDLHVREIFYLNHPCEYFEIFQFAVKFILLFHFFSFSFCFLFHFLYFINEELLKIGKRDSSSIEISTPYTFQGVQKVIRKGVLKLLKIFFQMNAKNCIC